MQAQNNSNKSLHIPQSAKPSYLITITLLIVAITEEPLEPVTTNTAATTVMITSTQDGGTDTSSMATATTPTTGSPASESTADMSTNTGPGVLGSSSTATLGASADLTSSNPDVNIAANQETNKRMYHT